MFRRFLAAAAVVGLAALVLPVGATAADPPPAPAYMVDGCIVRFPTAVPEILTTGGHVCSPRVTGVSVAANGDLLIHTLPVAGIVSATVEEDETLVMRGISAGPSVGFDVTVVRFYSNPLGRVVRADGTEVRGASSNVFVTWVSVPVDEPPGGGC
ncbi:MAG TPA: hypothetical protein VFX60_12695 [Micromonospora sp.]|nr:hypothetical protein [Micromonospora sp.]